MITWSFRKFSIFEKCPEMYHRTYDLKEKPVENQRKYLDGYVLHTLVEEYINKNIYQTQDKSWLHANMMRHVTRYITNLHNHPTKFIKFKDDKKDEEKAINKITKCIDNTHALFQYENFHTKKLVGEFEPPDGGVKINNLVSIDGSIDILVESDDGYTVVDLKTSESKRFLQKDQLVFYYIIVRELKGYAPKELYFFSAHKNAKIKCTVTEDDASELIRKMTAYTKQIETSNYRQMNMQSCWGCPHIDLCHAEHFGDFSNGRYSL